MCPCVVAGGATVACADVGAMYVARLRFVGAKICHGAGLEIQRRKRASSGEP